MNHTKVRKLGIILTLVGMIFGLTGCDGLMIPPPRPGITSVTQSLMVKVPGGQVNAIGGNLHITRTDITLDTLIGNWPISQVYNSANRNWVSNDRMHLDLTKGTSKIKFIDETGAIFMVEDMSPGFKIPGSHWIVLNNRAIRTQGGMVYLFGEISGLLEAVHWSSAEYPRLKFTRNSNHLDEILQCKAEDNCSTLYTATVASPGPSAITDLTGRRVEYTYDSSFFFVESVRTPLDIENGWPGTRYEYDNYRRLTSITNSHDERVEYTYYEAQGTYVATARKVGTGYYQPTWTFVYSGMNVDGLPGQMPKTTVQEPDGGMYTYVFDPNGKIQRRIHPDGSFWRWVWASSTFFRAQEISPGGVVRNFGITESGNIFTEHTSRGNIITYTYAPYPAENRENPKAKAFTSIVDSLGVIETRTYLESGVLESITNGEGDLTTYDYDDVTGDLTIINAAEVETIYSNRGDHGHFQCQTVGGQTICHVYDDIGNLLSSDGLLDEDPELDVLSAGQGGIVSRSFDGNRNISGLVFENSTFGTEVNTCEVAISYRADGRKLSITRPCGGDTEVTYNFMGDAVEEKTQVDGVWPTTTTSHDMNGRPVAIIKPNGVITKLTYSLAGGITHIQREKDWTDLNEVEGTVELEYDRGRLVEIRDSAYAMAPERYLYNPQGDLREVFFPDGESLFITRDVRGRVTEKTYWKAGASGYWRSDALKLRRFEYDYDLANRQIEVREDGVIQQNTTVIDGQVASVTFGNEVITNYSYNNLTGRSTGFVALRPVGASFESVATMNVGDDMCDLVMPASRCITERTRTFVGVTADSYAEFQMESQGSERLIADSTGLWLTAEEYYEYDELSNVLSSELGEFIYNAERNRLLQIVDGEDVVVDYVYDEAGFVIERNGVPIVWNSQGLVESIGTDIIMEWDGLGRKMSSVVTGESLYWSYGGEVTEDESGTNQKIDMGWMVSYLDDDSHEYRLFDFRGNVKLILDDLGETMAVHNYNGYELSHVTGTDESHSGFAGGTHVGEFVVLGARVYDPTARRFLSEDPVFQIGNQFSYTSGNPIRFWDPSGTQQQTTTGTTVSTTTHGVEYTGSATGSVGVVSGTISVSGTTNTVTTAVHSVPTVSTIVETTTFADGTSSTRTITTTHSNSGEFIRTTTDSSSPEGAVGPGYQGQGSTGTGKNGPPSSRGRRNSKMTGGGGGGVSPGLGLSCGLGFEIVPILMIAFAIRERRRRS